MPQKLLFIVILALFFFPKEIKAQQAFGDQSFSFLNLPSSARLNAMGGQQIAIADGDLQLAVANPSLLNAEMHRKLLVSNLFFPAQTNLTNLAYAHFFEKRKITAAAQLQYLNYGSFTATTQNADIVGDFRAGEFLMSGSAAWQSGKWSVGGTAKMVLSSIEIYRSNAFAADAGVAWNDTAKMRSFSFVVKNVGFVGTDYEQNEDPTSLPFDVQLGISQRLRYLPFRFSLNANNLHRWNIRYDDPLVENNASILGENNEEDKSYFTDELFRHLIFSGELYLGKVLSVQVAYNHRRKQEMRLNDATGLTGFSMGVGVKTQRFTIHYGLNRLNQAGAAHQVSFVFSTNSWKKKRKIEEIEN